jgi:hypothetical protein
LDIVVQAHSGHPLEKNASPVNAYLKRMSISTRDPSGLLDLHRTPTSLLAGALEAA